jgi:hypothetical protein
LISWRAFARDARLSDLGVPDLPNFMDFLAAKADVSGRWLWLAIVLVWNAGLNASPHPPVALTSHSSVLVK